MARKRRNVVPSDANEPEEKAPTTKTRKKTNKDAPEPTDVLYWPFNKQALLGRGTFGKVEVWYHHTNDDIVAAKVMKHNMYQTELEMVRRLKHENIVKYVTSFDDKETIVFELVSFTLEQLINDRIENYLGLSESLVKTLIRNISKALDYLVNSMKVVHRDIKPANILYDSEHKAFVLADLGFAVPYDSDSERYTAKPAGTRTFIKPSLYERIDEKWDDDLEVSIHTELWPLAVTYFFAATGKHPFFPTRYRHSWIKLALNRPQDSLCINEKGEYMNDLYGYHRLSQEFTATVFKPLLLSMMSNDASFKDYFNRVATMMELDTVYVFDVTTFKLCALPYQFDIDHIQTIVEHHFDYKHMKLAYDLNILSVTETDPKIPVPKTNEHSPLVLYSLMGENETDGQADHSVSHIAYRLDELTKTFFNKTDMYKGQEVRCVFTNTLSTIDECCEQIEYLLTSMNLYVHAIRVKQGELRVQFNSFETQKDQYFKLEPPSQEFGNMVSELKDRVTDALGPVEINDIRDVTIRDHDNVVSFRQHIELLNQRKLNPDAREHVLHCRKAMTRAVSFVLESLSIFLQRYLEKVNYCDRLLSSMDKLLIETTFAQSELNGLLVNEIMQFGKK